MIKHYNLNTEKENLIYHKNIVEQLKHFCPLIQAKCRIDCECFSLPTTNYYCKQPSYSSYKFQHKNKIKRRIYIAYCDNSMFSGYTTNEY